MGVLAKEHPSACSNDQLHIPNHTIVAATDDWIGSQSSDHLEQVQVCTRNSWVGGTFPEIDCTLNGHVLEQGNDKVNTTR